MSVCDLEDEDGFIGPIADYVSNECNREEDIAWFMQLYGKHGVVFDKDKECFIFKEGFKESYFKDRYDKIKDDMHNLTLEEFSSDPNKVYMIKRYVEERFGFYVYFDHAETLDSFVRELEYDTEYYVGETIDYHS